MDTGEGRFEEIEEKSMIL